MQTYLAEMKVAKPFWPEHVQCIDALPMTASGKLQRFVLKAMAAQYAVA